VSKLKEQTKREEKYMKKTLLILCGGLLVFMLVSPANSAEGPYVGVKAGLAMLTDSDVTDATVPGVPHELKFDSGVALAVAAGYEYQWVRGELEIAYQENDMDSITVAGAPLKLSGDVSNLSFLLNGYFDIKNETALTPFITAGIGFAQVDVSDIANSAGVIVQRGGDETVFAYQVGAGLGYDVNKYVTIDLTYRYYGTGDVKWNPQLEMENASHNIYLGLRYAF
jgi:opacity protein-like surface antigen